MNERFIYSLYGITVSLPFPCFALPQLPGETVPHVMVVEGAVPRLLEEPEAVGERWEASPGRYLLRGGLRAGRFLVEKGESITLERNLGAEDPLLAAHFLASVVAALLRQRGHLVLHADTVMVDGRGVVISGASGAGKSSTLGSLLADGATMVSNDITVVCFGDGGRIEALPGIPSLSLCDDAALAFGQDLSSVQRSPLRRNKVLSPHGGAMAARPVPLHAFYRLDLTGGREVRLTPLTGAAKFDALQSCVYGPLFPGEHPSLFDLFAAMADRLSIFRLERPESTWTVEAVTEKIRHG